jgi:hypothetical protein
MLIDAIVLMKPASRAVQAAQGIKDTAPSALLAEPTLQAQSPALHPSAFHQPASSPADAAAALTDAVCWGEARLQLHDRLFACWDA